MRDVACDPRLGRRQLGRRETRVKNNHQRVLADVLALDAWHDPFRISQDTYGVFAEVSFSEGRMGGDDADIPFTFNVSLKKALLTITLEEPLALDRTSVAREIPSRQTEFTRILRAKEEIRKKAGASARITPAELLFAVRGDISRSAEISKEEELRFIQTVPEILVTARPEGPNGYSWELEPFTSETLRGQPWDPTDRPRIRVRCPQGSGIDPSIKVEVRCALEDLRITSLVPKDTSLAARIANFPRKEINEAAAIQHLKRLLASADLHPGQMDNRFNTILIADVLALSS